MTSPPSQPLPFGRRTQMALACALLLTAIGVGRGLPAPLEAIFARPPGPPSPREKYSTLADPDISQPLRAEMRMPRLLLDTTFPSCESVAFSGDGLVLGVIHDGHSLSLHDLSGGQSTEVNVPNLKVPLLPGPGHSLLVNAGGARLVRGGQLGRPASKAQAVSSTASGRVMLGDDGKLLDLESGRSAAILRDRYLFFDNVALSGDGGLAAYYSNGHANAFGHDHGATEIFDVVHNRHLTSYDSGSLDRCVAVNGDGSLVADGREDSTSVVNSDGDVMDEGTQGQGGLTLYGLQAGSCKILHRWTGPLACTSLAFSPAGDRLVAGVGGSVFLLTVPEGKPLGQFPTGGNVEQVVISPNRIVAARTATRLTVWDCSGY